MELIAIREAARRLGVSDTAVRKAITAGRVTVAGRTESSGRPLLAWPQCADDWVGNSDATKRTHYGSQGSPRRADPVAAPAEVVLPTRGEVLGLSERAAPAPAPAPATAENPAPPDDAPIGRPAPSAPSLAQSKAVREAYMARLAKLEYEREIGKLVDADSVRVRAFNAARAARDALQTMPDRLAPLLAGATDVQEVRRLLDDDIAMVCARIADAAAKGMAA